MKKVVTNCKEKVDKSGPVWYSDEKVDRGAVRMSSRRRGHPANPAKGQTAETAGRVRPAVGQGEKISLTPVFNRGAIGDNFARLKVALMGCNFFFLSARRAGPHRKELHR